jgi:hypothetical protein
MPYDPRMLQMARAGVGMMAPPPSPFGRAAPQQPKQWWDQPLPMGKSREAQSPQDDPSNPDDPNAPKKPQQPSLLQMLMLGGQPTYSGTPRPGAASANPWGWLGGIGGGYK